MYSSELVSHARLYLGHPKLFSLVTYVPHLHTFHPSSGPRRSSDRQVLLLRFLIRPFFMPFLHRWGIQEMLQPNHLLLSGFQSSTSATRPSASVAVSLFVSPSLQTKLRKFTQYSSLLILNVLHRRLDCFIVCVKDTPYGEYPAANVQTEATTPSEDNQPDHPSSTMSSSTACRQQ